MPKVALFGLPASGKGTVAQKMQSEWGWRQLSTGDLIRRMRQEPGQIGEQLRALPPGSFASDALVIEAVKQELRSDIYSRGVIFDGFPRTLAQWEAMCEAGVALDACILMTAPEEMLVERAVNRRVHLPSGRVYNIKSAPPKSAGVDDETGEPLFWREDDHADVIGKRFEDFWLKTAPAIESIRAVSDNKGMRFVEIDAMREIEAVWVDVEAALVDLSRVLRPKAP